MSIARRHLLSILRHHRTGLYSLAVVVGLMAGAGAIAFRWAIDTWGHVLAAGAGELRLTEAPGGLLASLGPWWIVAAPVLSGLIVGPIMVRWARSSAGHGVSAAIWSQRHGDGATSPRTAIASVVAAAASIGGGASVGPEGPIAELGASTAAIAGRRLGLPRVNVRMLAAAGTAAGIAAAFNAPLAGALFALELILLDLSIDAFTFVVLACVSATVLSHQVLGGGASIHLPLVELAGDAGLWWVAWLGVAGGIFGVLFSRCKYLMVDVATRVLSAAHIPAWLRPAIGGLAVGLMLLAWPALYGESSLALDTILSHPLPIRELLAIAVLKIVATSLTLAVGFAGGVFAPSLFIGAALGAAFGQAFAPDQPASIAVYGVIGMAAVFTGSARAPLTAVVLLIEMTGQYSLLLPLMLASVIATFTSKLLTRTTIYTEDLRRLGDDVDDPLNRTFVGTRRACDLMTPVPAVLSADMSLREAASILAGATHEESLDSGESTAGGGGGFSALPVLSTDDERRFLGLLEASELSDVLAHDPSMAEQQLSSLSLRGQAVHLDDGATRLLDALASVNVAALPVLDAQGRLAGWLSEKEIIHSLAAAQREAQELADKRSSFGARMQKRWHQRSW